MLSLVHAAEVQFRQEREELTRQLVISGLVRERRAAAAHPVAPARLRPAPDARVAPAAWARPIRVAARPASASVLPVAAGAPGAAVCC